MDGSERSDTPLWQDGIPAASPDVLSRRDSHGMSPRCNEPYTHATSEHIPPKSHQDGSPRSQTKLALRDSSRVMTNIHGSMIVAPVKTANTRTAYTGKQRNHENATYALKDEDEDDVEEITPNYPYADITNLKSPSGRLILDSNGSDVQDIGQWFFVSQMPEHDLKFFSPAQDHWVKGIWDMARVNQPMYAAMGSFAVYKKAVLSGSPSKAPYYEQKGQMIRDIVANLNPSPNSEQGDEQGVDPLTIVAISILGFLEIRDGHLDAADTHLRAVCKFIDMPRLPPYAWLYCVWVDLRFALFTGQEPRLPFYIPTRYRELPASISSCQYEATRLGNINASECPRSPLFTLDMAQDLFCKLHALCYCADTLGTAEHPPYGQVYALEYGLRVVQARSAQPQGDMWLSNVITLLTSAIQLHVWMASRFWTPQRRESHLALIVRASKVIESFDDMITQWYISAGLESLLWVLFTIVATIRAHDHPDTASTLDLLYKALKKANIRHCSDFETRLKKWPWLRNWHSVQLKGVWAMLCARYSDLVPVKLEDGANEIPHDPSKARNRWFVGGLEFFNSL